MNPQLSWKLMSFRICFGSRDCLLIAAPAVSSTCFVSFAESPDPLALDVHPVPGIFVNLYIRIVIHTHSAPLEAVVFFSDFFLSVFGRLLILPVLPWRLFLFTIQVNTNIFSCIADAQGFG